MKETITKFFAIFISFILLSCISTSKEPKNAECSSGLMKGHLTISHSKFYFGSVDKNRKTKIEHNIVLSNKGSDTININKIDVSCGCILTKLKTTIIPPNKSINLQIEINTKKLKGYFNKVVYINSDADNSLELIRIKGEIL